ncbi:MAG: YbaB/EbfC family nucleoid-associated protein [Bacteroidetes bacterium]|jgi:DNA-binding YbaB/EbfC family protein|nr:YbaB/EbfC family nucleoid-associated protein [Bacteroidota bacterium]
MFGNLDFLSEKQKQLDDKLAEMELFVSTAEDRVQVKANGKGKILDLKIDPELVEERDTDAIEDFVLLAMNEMTEKVAEVQMNQSKDLLSGLLPGM